MERPEDSAASILGAPFQASSSLLSRRRKSRSRSINRPPVDPASPEVITSLISSLSTISVPLQTHFDNVPCLGSDIDLVLTSEQRTRGHGLQVRNVSPQASEEASHSPFLHPDDAATAPVIRMARAPPSLRSKTTIADASPSLARPTSKGSYSSSRAAYEDSAFGMITAEPGPRVSTAPSIASTSSRKSLKSQFGLLKKSSREFTYDKDRRAERLRKTSSYNDCLRHNLPRSRTSVRSMHSIADGTEKGRYSRPPRETSREHGVSSHTEECISLHSARESAPSTPGGIGGGRIIPVRESSLRHSFSSSSRQRRSTRHSRYSSIGSKDIKVDNDTGTEAEHVARRIQELKDQQQKIKNELEIDDSPDKVTRELPAKQTQSPQKPSEIGHGDEQSANGSSGISELDESAPAPAVMTGRGRSTTGNNPQFTSKATNGPIQTFARQSFDKSDQIERLRYRRSVEQPTSPQHHKRSPSGPVSPGCASVVDERPSSADSIDLAVLDYVSARRLTQKVIHPTTGREIAFSEVGDPKGHVVLCCLGMGLTRYLMAFYDELARSLHLRLVTLDRPGVGESGPYVEEAGTPLAWPDDVAIVCNHIKVTKFSILAHSAGAIYALATALRIPQHIRGRIHLLAPWIPPSQLSSIGSQRAPVPTKAVPYSQRILRALPTSILKVANSSFMSATSASLTTSLPKSSRRARRKAITRDSSSSAFTEANGIQNPHKVHQQGAGLQALQVKPPQMYNGAGVQEIGIATSKAAEAAAASEERERQSDYDNRLTHKIWELATMNANPAVDLVVCLERRQPIGFRYVDITRNVVIHHGSRDTRVPVDNVRWLGQTMRRCEVRILEGEGHGLMASATVMGNVLMEIGKEWEDWMTVVQGKRRATVGTRAGIAIQA
ncbi:hypothetical protein ETB97_009146 [Aspergillus alliaceus]|uniref:AB hydrolase-1 domain-containing protein n=1 Tax=Petromyces alliaceus TaxID=209559 RepID=A0A8H6AB83_PETAA|nr:hypothetical protein ETB97_009146 [Aspergillus burnettii]